MVEAMEVLFDGLGERRIGHEGGPPRLSVRRRIWCVEISEIRPGGRILQEPIGAEGFLVEEHALAHAEARIEMRVNRLRRQAGNVDAEVTIDLALELAAVTTGVDVEAACIGNPQVPAAAEFVA